VDDSAGSFPGDTQGIIKTGNTDEFFGIVDTNNGDTGGRDVVATWIFDITGAPGIELSIDMGAMGDFESSDWFEWAYSIDGGLTEVAFASTVDEAGSHTYTLESGTVVTLNDPMLMNGVVLTNDLAPFSTPLRGTGTELTLTLTANTNGGSEAIAFQNLILAEGEGLPPISLLEIFEIQGDGPASPYQGELVITEANVVTALGTDGFFMQTPTVRSDGNVDTSDGIFVFTGAAPSVAVGDSVDVLGRVQEFFGFTEITDVAELTVDGAGTVPAPVVFDAAVPSPDSTLPSCAIEFECYEGMYIEIADGAVTGPNQRFSTDTIAEVHITAAPLRTFREPGVLFPGIVGLPVWDGNPEVFELDPDKLGLPNQIIPAGSSFSARGALGFEFGGYELWPNELTYVPAEIPRPVRDREAGEFTVGSLNMFRFFDDIDDPPSENAQGQTRDDFVVSTAEYVRRKSKLADHVLNVLDAPDVLAVQEVEKIGVLEDLAVEIAMSDPTVVYTPILVEGNDIGTIDVGFMVRDTVTVESFEQLGYYETYFNPVDLREDILHDRPPLLLEGQFELEFGSFPVAVMTVHNRSLGGIEDPVDGPRVRQKRYEQAVSIADKVQTLQMANPGIHLVVLGDFNGFEFTDGYVDPVGQILGDFEPDDNLVCDANACDDQVDPDLTNQTLYLAPEERYSFIFRGNAQALDHALTAEGLGEFVAGYELGRGNSDAAFDLINDESTPLRSSDHDGLSLFVSVDADDDGVPDDVDVCPATVIPESVPTQRLGVNRYALVDEDGLFDTTSPGSRGSQGRLQSGPTDFFTVGDTAGCSCEQIIEAQHLGKGHEKFGCSLGAMRNWVKLVNP
jgi:predicted extracellular nuclease